MKSNSMEKCLAVK